MDASPAFTTAGALELRVVVQPEQVAVLAALVADLLRPDTPAESAWPEWMNVETAARYLDCTPERIRKLVDPGAYSELRLVTAKPSGLPHSLLNPLVGETMGARAIETVAPQWAGYDDELLDARQAAALLTIKPSTLLGWARDGRVPVVRLGPRHLRWTRPMLRQIRDAALDPGQRI